MRELNWQFIRYVLTDTALVPVIWYVSAVTHEVGHGILAIALGVQILSVDLLSISPSVKFATNATNAVFVNFYGGIFSAIVMSIVMVLQHRFLDHNKHLTLGTFLVMIITWQASLGLLEGYNSDLYQSFGQNNGLTIGNVLLTVPTALAITVYLIYRKKHSNLDSDYQHRNKRV